MEAEQELATGVMLVRSTKEATAAAGVVDVDGRFRTQQAAGSGQEGPWLEEEVDPAGSEAGKGADGVGGEHGDGANATRSGGVKRGSGCISSL